MRYFLFIQLLFIQITVFSQDLIIADYNGPTNFDQYEEFSVDITIENTGIVGANHCTFAVYLSTDNQWQASDILVESQLYYSPLGAGESTTRQTYRSRIDVTPGTYYLIIIADPEDYQTETDETNNILVIPNIVVTPPDVDFTFKTFSLDKSTYYQNGLVKPSYVLENLGTTDTGGELRITYVLSTDATFSQDDRVLHEDQLNLDGIDKINSSTTWNIVLPTVESGDYYVVAWIDRGMDELERFDETDESNNIFAIPIEIKASDADLVITSGSVIEYEDRFKMLQADLTIRNDGSNGIAGFAVMVELIDQNGNPTSATAYEYLNLSNSYIGPGEEKIFFLDFSIFYNIPGTYDAKFTVNPGNVLAESDFSNNFFIDNYPKVVIPPPPAPGVRLNSLTTLGEVSDSDQQINLNLNLTNTGNNSGFNQNYAFLIKDSENTTVHSENINTPIDFSPGQSANKILTLNLSSSLPIGSYQLSLSCTSLCYTTPTSKNIILTVYPTSYTVTGSIEGEDGQPITKGKLFLYQKNILGDVSFIQKIDPYEGPDFSFRINDQPHTLYFIPDPAQYPEYVPTIYGKTLTLQPINFFTASTDMNINMEVLKVHPLGPGTGVINGNIMSGNAQRSTSGSQPAVLSVEPIPVILTSSTGQVAGFTYTDASGFYEFKNLPRDTYQLMLGFELDNPKAANSLSVDITDKNMTVDLEVKPGDINATKSQLYLPQKITFDEFDMYQYGAPPISLKMQSDLGLPIDYSSSDNSVAEVINSEIVIKGVGTVVITANQAGNNFYLPFSEDRGLTINKANQTITFNPLGKKTYGDNPFTIESVSTSGLTVNLQSSDPTIATISNNMVTIHRAGTVEITAEQPGSELYEAALPVSESLTVEKSAQTISFDAFPELTSDMDSFVLSATSSSGLDVFFESANPEIVSIHGNIATIHKDGMVNITARQSGNQNYLAAEEITQNMVINLVLGIETLNLNKNVYPNPTTDFVLIQVPGLTDIEVFDALGRIRYDIVWKDNKLDFSLADTGVYFVKISSRNHTTVSRVIKK